MSRTRILIVEDDFLNRQLLLSIVAKYGPCDVATDGREAVDAVTLAYESGSPYALVFMDIILPEVDGQSALRQIRGYESSRGIPGEGACKVLMVTALSEPDMVEEAFANRCEGYINKPYSRFMIDKAVGRLGFASEETGD